MDEPKGLRICIDGIDILVLEINLGLKPGEIDVKYGFVSPERPDNLEEFETHVNKVIQKLFEAEAENDT